MLNPLINEVNQSMKATAWLLIYLLVLGCLVGMIFYIS